MRYASIDYKRRVCRAMNFISRNLERDLPLEEIAESASFSMYHFHRIFKAVVGETVAGFTRRLRLELAANRLLSRPNDDITTIALASGFSSSQNFAKAFRVHFGLTPTKYRESKIGNKDGKPGNAPPLRAGYAQGNECLDIANHERRNRVNGEVLELPDYSVAYVRAVGPYAEETCVPAFRKLLRWAGPRNYIGPGKLLAIYWDNPDVTPPDKCRFDTCIIVPDGTVSEGQVNIQTLSGGPHAVCRFEVPSDAVPQAWEDAFAWLCDAGFECRDTPCYEQYLNNAQEHPEGKWIFNICIPLKRA